MFKDTDKTIIKSVKEKINNRFLQFRNLPYYSPDLPWDKVFLSGGAICSLINDEEPNDWDWYFSDYDAMNKFKQHLINCNLWVKDINTKYGGIGVNGKMITSNAITMDDNNSFIVMVAGEPSFIKCSFDYVHCMPNYKFGDKLYISEKQYWSCTSKKLIVNNLNSVKQYRHEKFIKRGWSL